MKGFATTLLLLGFAAWLASGCASFDRDVAPLTPTPALPPPDFAFSFAYGSCTTNVLNTFKHTFRQGRGSEPSITVKVHLTDGEMLAIYRKMVAIGFWDYPEVFHIPLAEDEPYGTIIPSNSYRFDVQANGETKKLAWSDDITEPTTPAADRLRELIALIRQIIETDPAVKQLPELMVVCL